LYLTEFTFKNATFNFSFVVYAITGLFHNNHNDNNRFIVHKLFNFDLTFIYFQKQLQVEQHYLEVNSAPESIPHDNIVEYYIRKSVEHVICRHPELSVKARGNKICIDESSDVTSRSPPAKELLIGFRESQIQAVYFFLGQHRLFDTYDINNLDSLKEQIDSEILKFKKLVVCRGIIEEKYVDVARKKIEGLEHIEKTYYLDDKYTPNLAVKGGPFPMSARSKKCLGFLPHACRALACKECIRIKTNSLLKKGSNTATCEDDKDSTCTYKKNITNKMLSRSQLEEKCHDQTKQILNMTKQIKRLKDAMGDQEEETSEATLPDNVTFIDIEPGDSSIMLIDVT